MARICQITKKKSLNGNRRSHSMNATKHRFFPNLHVRRFWIDSKNRFIKLRISTKGMRIIDKIGIEKVLLNSHFIKK